MEQLCRKEISYHFTVEMKEVKQDTFKKKQCNMKMNI